MTTAILPVKRGISSPAVTNIPEKWDREWFRQFITSFLVNIDVRNAIGAPNVGISGNITSPGILQSISGIPPVLLEDFSSSDSDMVVIPGPPGASGTQGIPGPVIFQDDTSVGDDPISFLGAAASASTSTSLPSLASVRTADATSANSTLTADSSLTLNFSLTGSYALEIFLPFYEATLGTGGFQFDLNSGTASVGGVVYGVEGFVTASVANAAVTSTATATTASTVTTSSSAPSWFVVKGWVNITTSGTLAVRWSQNSTLGADPTTLKAGAYIKATKIG